jgi:hypothetical protein
MLGLLVVVNVVTVVNVVNVVNIISVISVISVINVIKLNIYNTDVMLVLVDLGFGCFFSRYII